MRLPLDGPVPQAVTRFTSDVLFAYAWSLDGQRLALSRRTTSHDVVLLTSEHAGR